MIYHPNSKQIIGVNIPSGSQHDIKTLIVHWKDLEYSVNAIEIDGKDSVYALT